MTGEIKLALIIGIASSFIASIIFYEMRKEKVF
jgi:hypothetical protein